MAKYRNKPVIVDAITFDELVEYGHKFIKENPTEGNYGFYNNGNERCGLPWCFKYQGLPVTHENDECYLVGTSLRMNQGDMLITDIKGQIYPMNPAQFESTYEKVEE